MSGGTVRYVPLVSSEGGDGEEGTSAGRVVSACTDKGAKCTSSLHPVEPSPRRASHNTDLLSYEHLCESLFHIMLKPCL